ncbi:MAG: hypothetical protein JWP95_1390 [Actinotalea sp.]|nr:hypothetical protein [Actinotalea sp.]
MTVGPTQNYEDPTLGAWKPHPVLAMVGRAALLAFPAAVAILLGLAAVHWVPPQRLGVNPWAWLAVEVACATVVLLLLTRVTRRLLPLTTLLRLTLYFPDRAPSRLAVAMRHYSPSALHDRLRHVGPRHVDDDHATLLLQLVAAVDTHDPVTRRHCERVQAYSALIGAELGLAEQDAARLSWAALLHDVGKLSVPAAIITKSGRPTAQEWEVLSGHPEAGMGVAAPLGDWLGPWLDAIGEHHERWDGAGYPAGLAGAEISLGARIVAVADAFDTITSARSYKKPLPAAVARAELARCAGQQFDPDVVRAFLAVGLGRLRRVAGPLAVLSGVPGLQTVHHLTSFAPSASSTLATAAGTSVLGLVLPFTASGAQHVDVRPVPVVDVAAPLPSAEPGAVPPPADADLGGAGPADTPLVPATVLGAEAAPEPTPPPTDDLGSTPAAPPASDGAEAAPPGPAAPAPPARPAPAPPVVPPVDPPVVSPPAPGHDDDDDDDDDDHDNSGSGTHGNGNGSGSGKSDNGNRNGNGNGNGNSDDH